MPAPDFGTDLRRPLFGRNRIVDMRCSLCNAGASFNSESSPDLPPMVGLIICDGCPICKQGFGDETWVTFSGAVVAPDWLSDMADAQMRATRWYETRARRS